MSRVYGIRSAIRVFFSFYEFSIRLYGEQSTSTKCYTYHVLDDAVLQIDSEGRNYEGPFFLAYCRVRGGSRGLHSGQGVLVSF